MNKKEQLEQYDSPEFWSHVLKVAKREAAPVQVVHTYRPVGIVLAISFLTLAVLLQNGVPVVMALLITALVAILVVRFS